MTDDMQRARAIPQDVLDAGTRALLDFRKSGGDWTEHPAHAAEAVLLAALRQAAVGEDRPLRPYALRNLRALIESGSTDKALMLSNLEAL